MNKNELIEKLELLDQYNKEKLLLNLEERKLRELELHNTARDKDSLMQLSQDDYNKVHGNKKFYKNTRASSDYLDNWIKSHSKGKIFLDFACGNGGTAIKAAKAGADLSIGIDISDISVENARKRAKEECGGNNVYFLQADAENTMLPDGCIDVCVCSGVLHHMDLSYVFPELRRILKKDGVIFAIEALDYNPLIKLYRKLTPGMRTAWEKDHILSYKDLDFAKRFFRVQEIKHWNLFSIAGTYLPFALPFFIFLDSIFLKLPGIKLMSWMFTFELHNNKTN